jgi:3-deoxy-D-manno-octulosonic-acid transferase
VDAPGAVGRFLDHWRPAAGLFVESELWPNLIGTARRRGVKLALLSARMTDESAAGWARAPGTARALLSAFELVLPQDPETAARLARLGATPGPQLNLKLLGAAPPVDAAELARLKASVGERKVVLAASTHPGEEALIAHAFRQAAAEGPPALLVVAPRHPDRGLAVAEELAGLGFTVARRSRDEPPAADAYVADTLGEMGLFFSLADVTVMGGSFLPGIGGHNPLEPARLARGVITGPHAFNARSTYDEMLDRVAAIEASGPEALARAIEGLLAYPHIARRIGEAALDYAEAQGAALEAALVLLEPLLP